MFARVIEIKTKPGRAEALCHTIHNKVLGVLRMQPGFVDEIVLVHHTEADQVLALSMWKTREDAERYAREHYAEVREIIRHEIHADPKVHMYHVDTSTPHRIAKGKAA